MVETIKLDFIGIKDPIPVLRAKKAMAGKKEVEVVIKIDYDEASLKDFQYLAKHLDLEIAYKTIGYPNKYYEITLIRRRKENEKSKVV
jgi:TusA-related sulfurtransferase